MLKPHTLGASFALHNAGNISFNLSFFVFGSAKASDARNAQLQVYNY